MCLQREVPPQQLLLLNGCEFGSSCHSYTKQTFIEEVESGGKTSTLLPTAAFEAYNPYPFGVDPVSCVLQTWCIVMSVCNNFVQKLVRPKTIPKQGWVQVNSEFWSTFYVKLYETSHDVTIFMVVRLFCHASHIRCDTCGCNSMNHTKRRQEQQQDTTHATRCSDTQSLKIVTHMTYKYHNTYPAWS